MSMPRLQTVRPPLLLLLAPVLLSACVSNPPRMNPPEPFQAQSELLESKGRTRLSGLWADESFQLGPYRVEKVKRGWTSKDELGLGRLTQVKTKEGFKYEFKGRHAWNGRCDYQSTERGLKIGSNFTLEDHKAQLGCSCGQADAQLGTEGLDARLNLDDEWKPMRGWLDLGQGQPAYALHQSYERRTQGGMPVEQGLKSPALGYWVDGSDGRPFAAVEVLHPGRAWLPRSLAEPQKEAMACLMAGLMLYGSQGAN